MTVIESAQANLDATFGEVGGRRVAMEYGQPDRAGMAVRNVVGLTEAPYGVVVVEGSDRLEYVDNAVSNRVPDEGGQGVYALLLDPQGGIETDVYVYNAGERLLCFTPAGRAGWLAEEWAGKTFIQDVEVREATDEFAVFGVHGAKATEKIASVLNDAGAPTGQLSFARGKIADHGVSVIRTDAPIGETGYEVVCGVADAAGVFDALLNYGLNAAPFGYRTWAALTLEAGTPLFETDLEGQIPNVAGLRNALDFEKGCYVGQEVVSRIENRGRPPQRLVGLAPERRPEGDAAVFEGDRAVGQITRAVTSPTLDEPVAFALVDYGATLEAPTVRVDGEEVPADVADLPFVEGGERSARLPAYP